MTKGKVTPRQVICAGCSASFESTAPRAKWCSRKCMDAKIWDKKHRKEVKCRECKSLVTRNYSRSFCSLECKDRWYGQTTHNGRAYWLKRSYNLSIEDYETLYNSQDGRCFICQRGDISLHIDHDHKCCSQKARSCGKCIRGLLCSNCNNGLGRFKDSVETLENALIYLKKRLS